jgi:hypothetical protein
VEQEADSDVCLKRLEAFYGEVVARAGTMRGDA